MTRVRDWLPLRPFKEWDSHNPRSFDPRQSVFIPLKSVQNDQIARGISPEKLQSIGIKVYNAAASNSISASNSTRVNFDTVRVNEGFASPTGTFTDVVIPRPGLYFIVGAVEWVAADLTRNLWVYKNGATQMEAQTVAIPSGSSVAARMSVTAAAVLDEGDTIGLLARHNSATSPLSINTGEYNCSMSISYLGGF